MEKPKTNTSTNYLFAEFSSIALICFIALRLLDFPLKTIGLPALKLFSDNWQMVFMIVGGIILTVVISWWLAEIINFLRKQGKIEDPERFLNLLFFGTFISGIILSYFFLEDKSIFWPLIIVGFIFIILLGVLASCRYPASVSPHAGWQIAWWLGLFIGLSLGGGFNASLGFIIGLRTMIIFSLLAIISFGLGFYLGFLG